AERVGFERALRSKYRLEDIDDIGLERFYRCCEVHFRRSLLRVATNGAIVDPDKERAFYSTALTLLDIQTEASFYKVVHEILEEFPGVERWINWYLHPSRGKLIFPALSTVDNSSLSSDTNAQESLGNDFKRTAPECPLDIPGTVDHAYRYTMLIECDYKLAMEGLKLRYGDRKIRKKRYVNDGRAPDTSNKLRPRSSARKVGSKIASKVQVGRPQGRRNLIPKLGGDVDWVTFGIPWSFGYGSFQASNTCALDTCLMLWYLLHRFTDAVLPEHAQKSKVGIVLQRVMTEITAKKYDKARWLWCTEVMDLKKTGHHDLWDSTENVFHQYLPGLITFSSTTSSKCNHPLCPASSNSLARIMDCLVAVNPHKIDQESLEASLIPGESPCSVVIDPKEVDEHGSEVFRKQCLHDPETKENTEWYICSGQRTYSKRMFITMPYMLVLDCLYHWRQGQQAKKPATILHVGGNEYHLAAIVYGSGAHFCGTAFIKGKAVFYDGQKARKLRWLDSHDISVPQGYQMNQVWYLRRGEDEPSSSPLPESDDPSSPRAESNSGDHDGAQSEQEQWAPRPSQAEDDRSGAEDDVETEPGSWSEVLSQPEDNGPKSDDDAESDQKPLLKRLSELEVCKKDCVDDNDREHEPFLPSRNQPKETESSSDEVDETTRKALYMSSVQRALKTTKSSLTVEEALAPGGPLSEVSRRRRLEMIYQNGIHVGVVRADSLVHTCVTCDRPILRGKFLAHRYVGKDGKRPLDFYHLKGACLDVLSAEDKAEVRERFISW
ncbi:MAG: hypothetical protein J3Q66DRAFT_409425, partial [Benniella sp.]